MRKNSIMCILVLVLAALSGLQAHEGGHTSPTLLPPFGPNGGKFVAVGDCYAELVVQANTVRLYVHEKDLKHIAEKVTRVTLQSRPAGGAVSLHPLTFNNEKKYFEARVPALTSARVVFFTIRALVDARWHQAEIVHDRSQ